MNPTWDLDRAPAVLAPALDRGKTSTEAAPAAAHLHLDRAEHRDPEAGTRDRERGTADLAGLAACSWLIVLLFRLRHCAPNLTGPIGKPQQP
ncbi:MAG: hypothetical protein M3N93_04505 [Acidobacteriota bacterium]|nr:hypothetical protein [Acidobacteriota bacterium]